MGKRRNKNKNHAMHNDSLLFYSDSWMYRTLRLSPPDSPSVRQASPSCPIYSPHGFMPNGYAPNFRPVYHQQFLPRAPQNVASISYQQPPTCPMHPMHPMQQQYMMLEGESQRITTSFTEPSSLYFVSPEPIRMALPASKQSHNLSFENDQQILKMYRAAESNQRYEIGNLKKERLTTDDQLMYDAIVAARNEITGEKVAIKVKKPEEVAIKVEEVEGAQDSEVKVKVEEPERIEVRKIRIQNPEGIEIQLKSELKAERERGTMNLENI